MIENITITRTAYRASSAEFQRLVSAALSQRPPAVRSFMNADTGVQRNYRENYPVFDTMPLDPCMDRG